MTDVISAASDLPGPADRRSAATVAGDPAYDVIELLFFAYRDFVRDADAALAAYGFGRAHHRVLHFVDRNPGLRVTDLLDILKITKQSLGRVLRELIDQGFVVQREGAADRRQRLLYVTERGDRLALELAQLQTTRVANALGDCGSDLGDAARKFLFAMVDPDERGKVARLIATAPPGGGQA